MSAKSMFNKLADERWFAIVLVGFSALLLIFISLHLGHKLPTLPRLHESSDSPTSGIPIDKIEQLSSKTAFFGVRTLSGTNEPFYTTYFEPAPKPPVVPTEPPKPVPPPMKKIPLVYQGVYETAEGERKGFVLLDGKLSIVIAGNNITNDWSVSTVSVRDIVLTNRSSQTNVYLFNHAGELEVPIK